MLWIKNCHIIDPVSDRDEIADILLDESEILKIKADLTKEEIQEIADLHKVDPEEILLVDARGLTAIPGLVDVHVHFRDPGFEYKEDICTGAKAAAAGGFTSVVLMANTKPAVDNEETLRYVQEKAKQTDIRIYQAGCITKGMKGEELCDMESLYDLGAPGFTDDGIPILDEKIVREAMEEGARLNVPLSFHEEDPEYITNNGVNRGKASKYYGIGGSDRQAEISLVERDVKIALETGASINIQHISTKEAVDIVRRAYRSEGDEVRSIHAEATPHHFTLTEDACIEKGTLAKMNPPLRTEEDRMAIIEGLKDGTIDLIATDHAPHSGEEKAKPITEAPSGIIGLETSLALGITNLVEPGHLTLSQLVKKMSANPAKLYHLNAGYLAEGGPSDLVLIDPKEKWTVEKGFSKSSNTPFLGETLTGKVKGTVCGGLLVYTD